MKLLMKALPYLVVAGLLFLLGSKIYDAGSSHGASVVQAKWDEQSRQDALEINRLKAEIEQKEDEHRAENTRITHELAEAQKTYEVALAEQRAEYDRRLQLSSNRAAIYQRQAESGAAQCRSLASHAARLDETLEAGRRMVAELSATLRQRDDQLRAVSKQLENDRNLFMTGDKK